MGVAELADDLRAAQHDGVAFDIAAEAAFGARTTYRVGGCAALMVTVVNPVSMAPLLACVARHDVPMVTLGRGSNMLVADRGFEGLVVVLGAWAERIEITEADDEACVRVIAGAAAQLPVVARRTATAGVTGFEWAVGVPGTIGGAVRMNAGGHGADMATSLVGIDVATRNGLSAMPASALGLGFRSSTLDDDQIVISAELRLAPGDATQSVARVDEIVRWRRENQPGGQNCGSVFVNPEPGRVAAGELIDRLGLRGFRIGTAEVSTKHANFIQADPGGRADDVAAVMAEVRTRVHDATGYLLRSEVRLIGFEEVS